MNNKYYINLTDAPCKCDEILSLVCVTKMFEHIYCPFCGNKENNRLFDRDDILVRYKADKDCIEIDEERYKFISKMIK